MYSIFYVSNKCECLEEIIVGRHWMKETKCQINWDERRYTLQVNSHTLTGPSYDNKQNSIESATECLPLTEEKSVKNDLQLQSITKVYNNFGNRFRATLS